MSYQVQTRNGGQWDTDGMGDNKPRTLAECEDFIRWATSSECDWTRDASAPHTYRVVEVDADGRVVRPLYDTERTDALEVTEYSVQMTDSETPSAWMGAAHVTEARPGAQDGGRVRFTVRTTDPAELEEALEADPMVIEYEEIEDERRDPVEVCREVASIVGDDGTGDLGVIVRQALRDDPNATPEEIADIVREAREDAPSEPTSLLDALRRAHTVETSVTGCVYVDGKEIDAQAWDHMEMTWDGSADGLEDFGWEAAADAMRDAD